jgi:hypothetical protein
MQEDRYVNDVEAAKILSMAPQTLRNLRFKRLGPPYVKKGRSVRYSLLDLHAYMRAGLVDPSDSK